MKPSTGSKTLWSELLPYEFNRRLDECPIVYLPLGLCEPHGQVSAFGLDTLKAEWLCLRTAEKVGGVVAPSMGYHIHETGYHARWLEDEVGDENPLMTGIPPAIFIHLFLYQLRTFVNAGFRKIVVLSGHSGGNQKDLRLAAEAFMKRYEVEVWVRSDPELVEGLYEGDHAGKYEISQLMYIRPELVEMDRAGLGDLAGTGGRLALGSDAGEANPELGKMIMEACLESMVEAAARMKSESQTAVKAVTVPIPRLSYADIEEIWREVSQQADQWVTANPWPSQSSVSPQSQWKPYERYR
ncbi:creatininase family protein [Cohnella mopanensis]|uniref:creatininase family protein n=1 Tax=Cohnella mopanensis TaxID=2911966 RepID=UPI001EF7562E|nr:creatininase family protein [Cohnella mopanensis]